MKNIILILSLLLSSCELQNSVIVWNAKDIIGFAIGSIALLIIGILFLVAWILDKWQERKKKK